MSVNDSSIMDKLATILVVLVTFSLCKHAFTENQFFLKVPNQHEDLQVCIFNIIKTYFDQYINLAYIDINGDQEIIKTVNSALAVSVTSRTSKIRNLEANEGYLITARNVNNFTYRFPFVAQELFWNPYGRFLIVIKHLLKEDITTIFDLLLKLHVINVVVVDEADTSLYTYNPFENYLCGKSYERIIDYGKCSKPYTKDLYPNKLVTGLKNCTFRVHCPHWPPFSMDPLKRNINLAGIEDFVLNEISDIEQFKVNYSYVVDGEIFTVIQENSLVLGPLDALQNGETDIILGGMLLTQQRARVFSYICSHLAYVDEVRFLVKKATIVSPLKNIYLEFNIIVWITLLFSFVAYFIFFVVVVRPKDSGQACLNMLAYMFLSGTKIKNRRTRIILISWIWFAYLINAYYQTTLVSITSHPHKNYQPSDVNDIAEYELKPCVSKVVRDFLSIEDLTISDSPNDNCLKLLDSIHTVSRSFSKFTVVFNFMYFYNERSFYDEMGDSMIYSFKAPLSKIVYGIYMYKGFPLQERLYKHVLKMRESGLIQQHIKRVLWQNNKKYSFNETLRKPYYIIPWCILIPGQAIATAVLVLEIFYKKLTNSIRRRRGY